MYVLTTYRQLKSLCEAEAVLFNATSARDWSIVSAAISDAKSKIIRDASAAGILDKVRSHAAGNQMQDVVALIDNIVTAH